LDLAKYQAIFLEEATEHLAEISRALLELEKSPTDAASIDAVFRGAHSIKGMAASLEYDSVTELSHKLEDMMDGFRAAGAIEPTQGLPLVFRGLEGLEKMVGVLREKGELPPPDPELVAAIESFSRAATEPPSKKD